MPAVLPAVRGVFRAVAAPVAPEAARLEAAGWEELEGTVERFLAERPPALRRQLGLFLRVLQWLPLARYGRPFTRLDPGHRRRFLAGVQDAPLLLVRRGFWGLRTLVYLGYYTRGASATEIGYRADPRGWEVRR